MVSTNADFVIVGGGTAGLALATRLSEDAEKHILVLEAGQDMSDDPRVQTPALWSAMLSTSADWAFMSTPQKALFDKQVPLPAGKMLGGSSGLNGCAFAASSKLNIDTWESIGNPGWNWKSLSKFYKRSYTLNLPSPEHQRRLGLDYVDESVNGTSGPVQASFPDATDDPVVEAWVKSFQELGFPMKTDPFSESASGGFTNATAIHPQTKTRSYAGNAYYGPAKGRPNLEVITGARVQKIILESDSSTGCLRATGVLYIRDGQQHAAHGRGEIIISAGTYNSPKLLELSGIGQRQLLESNDIPVLVDNKGVGENLQDHVVTGISYQVEDHIKTKDDIMRRVPEAIASAKENYEKRKFGPFTVAGHFSSALLPVPDFLSENGQAEREAIIAQYPEPPLGTFEHDLYQYVLACLHDPQGVTGGYFSYAAQGEFKGPGVTSKMTEMIQSKDPDNFISILSLLLSPLSRGSCHITSNDVEAPPAIDPRWLSHPLDVELFARHVRYIESIAASGPLKNILKQGGKRMPDTMGDFRNLPLDMIKEYVRASARSCWHSTGTCAMMPEEKGGVVDPRLRVYGVKGLRIVDASVMPIIPRANTTSAVYAVAEKAADLIKEDMANKTVTQSH